MSMPRINLLDGCKYDGVELPSHRYLQMGWYGSGLRQPEASGAQYCWTNGNFQIDYLPIPTWIVEHVNTNEILAKTAEVAFPMSDPNASLEILKDLIRSQLDA